MFVLADLRNEEEAEPEDAVMPSLALVEEAAEANTEPSPDTKDPAADRLEEQSKNDRIQALEMQLEAMTKKFYEAQGKLKRK